MVNVASNEIQKSGTFGRYRPTVDMLTPAVTGNGNTEISK